jgi:heme exporter protein D
MRYEGYIVAAYAVFFAVMAWDALAPQWQLHRVLRTVRLAARRQAPRRTPNPPTPPPPESRP